MDVPIGNQLTPRTTPLHVYQLVLVLLQMTFEELEDTHPFRYRPDPDTTGIFFDTVYNKDSEVYGGKPVIVVSRGGVSTSPTVTGDRGLTNNLTGHQLKTGLVSSSVTVKIISSNPGMVDILSNEVFNTLTAIRTLLPSLTSISTVSSFSLSEIAKYEESDVMYYCVAGMSYNMQYKWTHKTKAELLNSISIYLRARGTEDYRHVLVP